MSVVTRIRTSEELTVPFHRDEVWAVLADVAAYPDWWPANLRVEILHDPGNLLGAEFEVRPVMGRMFRIRFEELEGRRTIRLRFFGGSLEGPGGFHLERRDGATHVRYEMDVFARGLDVAVLSLALPMDRIHASRMRSVLRSLASRLKGLRKVADREEAQAARAVEREAAGRLAATAAARRAAEEEAARRAAEEGARRSAEQAARVRAATELAERRAVEEAASRAAEREKRKRAEEEAAARAAAEEAERRAAEEAAARGAAEAEAKKRAEEEAAARAAAEEAERRAAQEEAARLAAEVEAKRRAEEEAAARAAAEETERRAAEEAERRAAEEAAARAAAEAEAKKRAEEEAAARAAAEEAERRAAEEAAARLAAEAEAKRRAEEEAAARAAAEEVERRAAEEAAARLAAETEAKRRAEEEAAARVAAEEAERRAAEEAAARLAAEAEAKRRAEEEAAARAAAEEVERRAAEEEAACVAAEAGAKRRAEEEAAARVAAEEVERRAAEEEAACVAAEAGAKRRAEEEAAARVAAEEAERRAAQEEEAARLAAEVEAKRRAEEKAAGRAAAEETERRAAEEEAVRLAAEVEAKRRAEEEAAALAAQESVARTAVAVALPSPRQVDQVGAAASPSKESWWRTAWRRISQWLIEAPASSAPKAPVTEFSDVPPSSAPGSNFETARRYLEALSSAATPDEISQFLAPGVSQEEFPHRFLDGSATRDFAGILETRARALARFATQRYELTGATGGGSQVAMELRWKGSVATMGEIATEGQDLDARLAIFLKLAEGRIVRERIYACFEPWSTKAERRMMLDERVAHAGQSTMASAPAAVSALPPPMGSNFDIARTYLEELGARAGADTIARFFAPDAVQEEFPNRLLPGGAHRDLLAIKLARARGLALMSSEKYELLGATGGGSVVALEVAWSGVVGEGLGLFKVGQRLESRLAIFLKFRDGLIVAQRNYDCA